VDYVSYTSPGFEHLAAVELGTAGMEWPASTGPFTLTMEHIADCVTAANDDPHIIVPRIKLGHTSTVNGTAQVVDPFAELDDAAPVFGRIINLRTANEGAVLLGDMVDVPAWLAEGMPSLYPNRSGEWRGDITTEAGKHYSMVLTAVSLLGVFGPGITDLEDLISLASNGPAALDPAQAAGARSTVPPSIAPAATSVSIGLVRDRFNFDWATDDQSFPGTDTYWWWARDIRVDPPEIIVDDDEGGLWRVPFTTDGADAVTFDTPIRVRETFVDLPAAAQPDAVQTAAPPTSGQRVLASNLGRPSKDDRPTAASRSSNDNDPEEGRMTPEELALLGLPEDATDDQIEARRAQVAELADPTVSNEDDEVEEVEEPEPVAASQVPEGMTLIDSETLAGLRSGAQDGQTARAQQVRSHRSRVLDEAISTGRIPPARRDHYATLLGTDPEGTERMLTAPVEDGGLAPGLIPVTEQGLAPADDAPANQGTGLIPELNAKED